MFKTLWILISPRHQLHLFSLMFLLGVNCTVFFIAPYFTIFKNRLSWLIDPCGSIYFYNKVKKAGSCQKKMQCIFASTDKITTKGIEINIKFTKVQKSAQDALRVV